MSYHASKGLSAAAPLSFQWHGRGLTWTLIETTIPLQLSQHTTSCKNSCMQNPLIFMPLLQSIVLPIQTTITGIPSCAGTTHTGAVRRKQQQEGIHLESCTHTDCHSWNAHCWKVLWCPYFTKLGTTRPRGPVEAQSMLMNESTLFLHAQQWWKIIMAKVFHVSTQALDYAFLARNLNSLTILHIVFTSSQESVIPEFIVRLGNILQGTVCWQTLRMYSLYSVSVCGLTLALS